MLYEVITRHDAVPLRGERPLRGGAQPGARDREHARRVGARLPPRGQRAARLPLPPSYNFV